MFSSCSRARLGLTFKANSKKPSNYSSMASTASAASQPPPASSASRTAESTRETAILDWRDRSFLLLLSLSIRWCSPLSISSGYAADSARFRGDALESGAFGERKMC
jgi:hypothetical protein